MPQDAFNLRHCIQEANTLLKGGKINRIIQPNKDEVSFNIYTGKSLLKLILSTNASNARVCLSKFEKEPPLVAPNFCMLLRKHLSNGEILNVEQVGFERVIAITVHCTSDFTSADRILYCEIMGKYSNLILTENGIILGALKTTSLEENLKRVLFPGAKYSLPAPQDKISPLDKDKLSELLSNCDGDIAKFLFENVSGIAMPTAIQIVESYSYKEPFSEHIQKFLFDEKISPCVKMADGVPVDFSAKEMPNSVPFDSVNEAQDHFFTYRETSKDFDTKKNKLKTIISNLIKKQERNLAKIRERQAECENMEENKLKGELITSYMYSLKEGMRECYLANYYDEDYKEIKIALDERLTPAQNAQKYFKKYNKQKRTLVSLEPQLKKLLEDMNYSKSVLSFIINAESVTDLKEIEEELIALELIKVQEKKGKKKEAVIPFREFDVDGFTVLAGRNNVQNDRLLKRIAQNDIWLHVQKYHSSHVAIITEGRPVPDEVLLRAAEICAYYSEAKGGSKVPVDYCERRFVKKPPKTNAGFVIYTDYKTLLAEPKI